MLNPTKNATLVKRPSIVGVPCRAINQATDSVAAMVPCAAHMVRLTIRFALRIRVFTWAMCETKIDSC